MSASIPLPRLTLSCQDAVHIQPNTIHLYRLQEGISPPRRLTVERMNKSTVIVITSLKLVIMVRIEYQTQEEYESAMSQGEEPMAVKGMKKLQEIYLAEDTRSMLDECAVYLIYATDNGRPGDRLAAIRELGTCQFYLESLRLRCPIKCCIYKTLTPRQLTHQEDTDATGTCLYSVVPGLPPRIYVEDEEVTHFEWWVDETVRGLRFSRMSLGWMPLSATFEAPRDIWMPYFVRKTYMKDVMFDKAGKLRERHGIDPIVRLSIERYDYSAGPTAIYGRPDSLASIYSL